MAHFGLAGPTADLGHRIKGLLSIDHIAVPSEWRCPARHVVAEAGKARLSDHDIYLIDTHPDVEAVRKP